MKTSRSVERHVYYSLGMNSKILDCLFANGPCVGKDHGSETQLNQQRSSPANPIGCMMPASIQPRGEVVQGEHAGTGRQVWDGEIRAVENVGVEPLHFTVETPQPPAPLEQVAWFPGLVGDEVILIFRKLRCEGRYQFSRVARQASGAQR